MSRHLPKTRSRFRALMSMTSVAALLAVAGCADETEEQDPIPPPTPSESTPAETPSEEPTDQDEEAEAAAELNQQGVAAAHPEAVEAGMQILEDGGNAVDAAIATSFAISVVEPYASGIGGGGSTLLASPSMEPVGYDYREVVAENGEIPDSGTGVPGMVDGMATLHEEHGSMEWSELLAPSIELAEEGFEVTELLAQRFESDWGPASISGLSHFHSWGQPLDAGDTLVQEELAETLRTIADEGAEAFYTGSIADELSEVDGLDAETLANYETKEAPPVSGPFGDYEFVSAAPPLPGAAVVQQLQIAESLGAGDSAPGSADYIDQTSQAWQTANQSVSDHFGDPDFVDVPTDQLTDAEANANSAEPASAQRPMTEEGERPEIEAGNTTHVTVVDESGLTVSMTNTLTSFWGGNESEYVGGFFLNDQLSRFDAIDTPSNQPEAGRKSVSWSAPSMVLDDQGRVVMGIGTPGGHQIPNILTSVMVPWALHDAPLQEAIDAPRHSLQDGVLAMEQEPSAEVSDLIDDRGWEAQVTTRADAVFGSVQALEINYEDGSVIGAQDSRRDADFAVTDVEE
ncbi:gamma-glutamyltransferase family protein [Yaniella halotolerans]|uniref:gamma-glutamyltransferase family protein n=1 Tax=Yaniella halotolerans TaxID=225453 RepID=UPI0003B3A11F|nr:gamma-glutamyltransferase [Yaniella halotolerans]